MAQSPGDALGSHMEKSPLAAAGCTRQTTGWNRSAQMLALSAASFAASLNGEHTDLSIIAFLLASRARKGTISFGACSVMAQCQVLIGEAANDKGVPTVMWVRLISGGPSKGASPQRTKNPYSTVAIPQAFGIEKHFLNLAWQTCVQLTTVLAFASATWSTLPISMKPANKTPVL